MRIDQNKRQFRLDIGPSLRACRLLSVRTVQTKRALALVMLRPAILLSMFRPLLRAVVHVPAAATPRSPQWRWHAALRPVPSQCLSVAHHQCVRVRALLIGSQPLPKSQGGNALVFHHFFSFRLFIFLFREISPDSLPLHPLLLFPHPRSYSSSYFNCFPPLP